MLKENKCFNFGLDWLEINVQVPEEIHKQIYIENTKKTFPNFCEFGLKLQNVSSPHYKYVIDISYEGQKIAVLCYMPHSKILKPNSGTLRIQNWVLYKSFYKDVLQALCLTFDLEFLSISRMDVCYDFLIFENEYEPLQFIRDFAAEIIQKVGKANFAPYGNTKKKGLYHSLKFGSNTSACTYTLYNKTLEMQQKKFKQYIVDTWTFNGYIEETERKKDVITILNPVWRLEFSIKNTINPIINIDTGEIYSMQDYGLLWDEKYKEIFTLLYNKHFTFIKYTKNKDKHKYPIIKLLNLASENCKRLYDRRDSTSGRAEKILINKIDDIIIEMKEKNLKGTLDFRNLMEYVINTNNLQQWWEIKKFNKNNE